ncbi:TniQ family protein [Stenotrophomonas maltophilia]|uniref:TniQ family protein n=1 Tax=Stenotrophomonas maltophilia TaxID=40324 RepID=UPI003917446A
MKLLAAGTPETESLSSYSLRLSKLCGVPWTRFISMIDSESGSKTGGYTDCTRLSGPGPVSLRRARTLERMTGQRLVGSTLHGIGEIVSGRSEALRRVAAWCPICLSQGAQEGLPNFSRLIWRFASYSHCSVHGARIECACPHCKFASIRNNGSLLCLQCKGSLEVGIRYDPPSRVESWTDHCIEELIGWTSSHPAQPLRKTSLARFLSAVDALGEAKTCSYLPPKKDRDDFVKYIRWRDASVPSLGLRPDTSRVDLGDLLRASAKQCVSVLDMLLRPDESASALLPGVQYSFDLPMLSGEAADDCAKLARIVEALTDDVNCVLPAMQSILRCARIQRAYKSRMPGHYSRYKVQLRIQRSLYVTIPPGKINLAFCAAMKLTEQGADRRNLPVRIAKNFCLPEPTAVGVTRSASIVLDVCGEDAGSRVS